MRAELQFWKALEGPPVLAGLSADWAWRLGPARPWLENFLHPSSETAGAHPCLAKPSCECRHVVRETSSGLVAVCTCGPDECEPFSVQREDLVVRRLDLAAFGESIRQALGFDPPRGAAFAGAPLILHECGTCGPLQATVYLGLGRSETLLRGLHRLWAARADPAVLLTPTGQACTAEVEAALRDHATAHLALSSALQPEAGGQFKPIRPLEPLWAGWVETMSNRRGAAALFKDIQQEIAAVRKLLVDRPAPREALPEPVARQLFALVKQLEQTGRWRKAPILQVFRLYCLESLSAGEVAQRCNCSKALVIERLAQLRRVLGRNPAELRPYSAHFEQMDRSLSDSRARKIDRARVLE